MKMFRAYQAISALAGSGKTFQLTNRYIALLALGMEPSRIMAITFTRKAAGEIFNRIVTRLARAALSDAERGDLEKQLQIQLGEPGYRLESGMVHAWLMKMTDAMPELRISTIDSFFGTLLRTFAFELGLPARQELLEGSALERAREEALAHAFTKLAGDTRGREAFIEAFKLTASSEQLQVREAIESTIDDGYAMFLDVPDEQAWGQRGRIWRDAEPWWMEGEMDHGACTSRIDAFTQRYLGNKELDAGYAKAWKKILEALRQQAWKAALTGVLAERLFDACEPLRRGKASVTFGRASFTLAGDDARDALFFVATAVRGIIENNLRATQGMWRLLDTYHQSFHTEMRMRGRLSFTDVPILLDRMCAEDVKLDIDYRMDGRIDHWMMDEFQDTNQRQWSIIRRLADEVLQSTEGNRSFFYVGDVKQAIYGWRGGESTLFDAVHKHYADKFKAITRLDTSWRSSPIVLDVVNEAFGHIARVPCLREEYAAVARRWADGWQTHQPAPKNAALPGRVEWHILEKGEDMDGVKSRLFLTARVVERLIQQGARNICVLVRTNKYGDRVAVALRACGIAVRREASPQLLDNPVISALLSMLRFADHPDDEFAWPHIQMTPLREVLQAYYGGARDAGALADFVRTQVARMGVAGLLGEIIDRCRHAGQVHDAFTRLRLRQLLDLAADYDRNVAAGPSEFAQRAATSDVNDPGADSRVVVMTMHKAKGLEFDVVVLPELQGTRGAWDANAAGELKIGHSPDDASGEHGDDDAWVLQVPVQDVAAADPVLRTFVHRIKERRMMDELCLLYVAMTRARQGLYLISEALGENSSSINAVRYLSEALRPQAAELIEHYPGITSVLRYACGDPAWMTRSDEGRKKDDIDPTWLIQPAAVPVPALLNTTGLRRLLVRTPSGEEKTEGFRSTRLLFGAGKASASARGTVLHDLFSRIVWYEPGTERKALEQYEALHGPCLEEIRNEFVSALASPEVARALGKPSTHAEVWREQAFEWAGDDAWVSGRMDRVVVERDTSGGVTCAQVIDFKSDRIKDASDVAELKKRYAPQVKLYREVLARLTGCPEPAIRASFVLTQTGAVIDAEN